MKLIFKLEPGDMQNLLRQRDVEWMDQTEPDPHK